MKMNEMIIEPCVWGPHYWYILHTIAFCYPLHPNAITRKKYYEFVHNLHIFIPNKNISTSFSQLLEKYPVTTYLDNRESFIRWTHFIHNKINKKLDKPIISLQEFYKIYKKKNKNPEKNNIQIKKIIQKMIYIIILLIFIGAIYYLYNK